MLLDRHWLIANLGLEDAAPDTIGPVLDNANALSNKLPAAFGSDRRSMLLAVLRAIRVAEHELRIDIRLPGLMAVLAGSPAVEVRGVEAKGSAVEHHGGRPVAASEDDVVSLTVPVTFKRRGVETRLILEGAPSSRHSRPDPALIKTIARAHVWFEELVTGRMTMTELASREGMKVSSVAKLLHLACLAPDIVEAMLAGRQSLTLIARHLIRAELPILWSDQRAMMLAGAATAIR